MPDSNTLKPCPFCAYDQARLDSWVVSENTNSPHTGMGRDLPKLRRAGATDLGESGAIEMWNLRRETFPA